MSTNGFLADDDDLFKDTRMSFGDHIEDLRTHLLRAIYGLLVVLLGGLVLDGVGYALNIPWLGVGRPMFFVIKEPAERQMQQFYSDRAWRTYEKAHPLPADPRRLAPVPEGEEFARLDKQFQEARERREAEKRKFEEERRRVLAGDVDPADLDRPERIEVVLDADPVRQALADPKAKEIRVPLAFRPLELAFRLNNPLQALGKRMSLTTLSAQEALVVYFKVAIVCSLVLASPWVFGNVWAFVAAGLYPQEKRLVYRSLGPAVTLFVTGVVMCQFLVMPRAVDALLAFNAWLDIDPDLRLNDWLSFAIMMPLVFGVSFQTPLVMVVMARIGLFSWRDYQRKWRHALFILAVVAAVITPTPDVISLSLLVGPMFGLYWLGIWLCKRYVPEESFDDADREVAV